MLCPKCANEISLGYNQTKCPHCGAEIGSDVIGKTAGEPVPLSAGLRPSETTQSSSFSQVPLWDNEGPFFTRLFNTWKKATFYPSTFFKTIPTNTGLGRPLFYAIILGLVSLAGYVFWSLVPTILQIPILGMDKETLEALNAIPFLMPFLQKFIPYIIIGLVILSPIITIIGLFIWSGILHICLIILGGNKKGFEATFRSAAYGDSPNIFMLIPVCGGCVAGIWLTVTTIIGLKQTHQIPTWKAIVAFLLPIILCACLAVIAAVVVPFFFVNP